MSHADLTVGRRVVTEMVRLAAFQVPSVATLVRSAVGATLERLLGLELGAVTVLVDGVGS